MAFSQLSPRIQEVLAERFQEPTAIQRLSFSPVGEEKNCLLIAPTGSGKTEAALLPLFDRLLAKKSKEPITKGFQILYITPLRALNRDIYRRTLPVLCERLGISVSVRHGDTTQYERRKQTLQPPELLITTPETLQAVLTAPKLGLHLQSVWAVIIDEIHELVDNKRGTQLSLALERVERVTKKPFQRIGLSATVGTPQEISAFLSPHQPVDIIDATQIEVKEEATIRSEYPCPESIDEAIAEKLQTTAEAAARFRRLLELSQDLKTVLVFTNTRQFAEVLGWRLARWREEVQESELAYEVHHSSLSRSVRTRAETEFRDGRLDLVFATSSLELGIDIGQIDLVCQYMSPRQVATFVQRLGRSGHSLTEASYGIILSVNPRDAVESAVIARRARAGELEETRVHPKALDVLMHQMIGILLRDGPSALKDLYDLLRSAYPYQDLEYDLLKDVALFAADAAHLVWIAKIPDTDEIALKAKSRKAREFYHERLSVIPDTLAYRVVDVTTQSIVGTLDEAFVSMRADKGTRFILRGSPWQILAIHEDATPLKISVAPIDDSAAALPTWVGDLIPVPFEITQEALELLNNASKKLFEIYPIDANSKKAILDFAQNQRELGLLPKPNEMLLESAGRSMVLHTFFGSKTNETLGLLLSGLLSARTGQSVVYRADPYAIVLKFPVQAGTAMVTETLNQLRPEHVRELIFRFLENSELFTWRLQHVAQRMGVIRKQKRRKPLPIRAIKQRYGPTIVGDEAFNEVLFDKLDVERLEDLVDRFCKNEIQLKVIPVQRLESPLAKAATEVQGMTVFRGPPDKTILAAVKKRLEKTRINLICMRPECDYERSFMVSSLEEIIRCPRCQSKFIAVSHLNAPNVKKLLRKQLAGKSLDREEQKELRTAKKAADLVLTYGRLAAFVMAGRGIGPTTAIRVLRTPYKDEPGLILEIMKAEVEFARTREFWD
ncbi:MAG: DEAD/DEAH box helicase [Candidatus Heimdallarchaeota archaeon]